MFLKRKIIYAVTLILSILCLFILGYTAKNLNNLSKIERIKNTRNEDDDLVFRMKINDMVVGNDDYLNEYRFPVKTEDEGKCIFLYPEAIDEHGNPLKVIFNETVDGCITVNFEEKTKLIVYNNYSYNSAYIQFTNLPIISLYSKETEINKNTNKMELYGNSYIINPYFTNEKDSNYYEEVELNYHVRGKSSVAYPKKSYKLNIKKDKSNFEKNRNISLLNMRNDDDWILDAMAIDTSKIRNILSYKLWNQITNNRDYIVSDYNADFVELFIDNEFYGLYVLKESVDQKTFNLKENDFFIKTNARNIEQLIEVNDFSQIEGTVFKSFELVYPKEENITNQWTKFQDFFINLKSLSPKKIADYEQYLDLDNIVDYYIFISLIYGSDNTESNMLLIYDDDLEKLYLYPWDLDLTFGLLYHDITEESTILDRASHDLTLSSFIQVIVEQKQPKEFYNRVNERWKELRSLTLHDDFVLSLIDNFVDTLSKSNILKKDESRWEGKDTLEEISFIREWIIKRMNFLDGFFETSYYKNVE